MANDRLDSSCPASPEYQQIIDSVAHNTYQPEKLGNLDELRNKFNCEITSPRDAQNKAIEALTELDDQIKPFILALPHDPENKTGIGIGLQSDRNGIRVTDVYAGGPALDAGLKAGDKILGIDGEQFGANGGDVFAKLVAPPYKNGFGGLGAGLVKDDGGPVTINNVEKKSAAAEMGLKSGDKILSIDGRPVSDLPLAKTQALVAGPYGSEFSLVVERNGMRLGLAGKRSNVEYPTAALEVERDGKKFEMTVARKPVQVESVSAKSSGEAVAPGGQVLPQDTAYVKIENFAAYQTSQKVLDAFSQKDMTGKIVADSKSIILDLRDNPGGSLFDALDTTSAFMKGGPVFSLNTRIAGPANAPEYRTEKVRLTPSGWYNEITGGGKDRHLQSEKRAFAVSPSNLVVLVNEGTAGAAEIVADALRVNAGAKIVGTKSFGLGLEHTTVAVGDRRALLVPQSRIFTSSGNWLGDGSGNGGITPDVTVANGQDTPFGSAQDEQLRQAIGLIEKK